MVKGENTVGRSRYIRKILIDIMRSQAFNSLFGWSSHLLYSLGKTGPLLRFHTWRPHTAPSWAILGASHQVKHRIWILDCAPSGTDMRSNSSESFCLWSNHVRSRVVSFLTGLDLLSLCDRNLHLPQDLADKAEVSRWWWFVRLSARHLTARWPGLNKSSNHLIMRMRRGESKALQKNISSGRKLLQNSDQLLVGTHGTVDWASSNEKAHISSLVCNR